MNPWIWLLLPDERITPMPIADTRAPLSNVTLRKELGEGAPAFAQTLDATLAADFPVVGLDNGPWSARLGLSAATFMGFSSDGELTFGLRTFDGLFGFPLDVAVGPWSLRLQWAHLSAHYGDGVRHDEARPTNLDPYSREYIQLTAGYTLGPAWFYGGGRLISHTIDGASPLGLQAGAQVIGPWKLAPFAAADLKIDAEDDWTPSWSGQLGLLAPGERHRFRLGLVGYTGLDDTGKLAEEPERYIGLQFGFDTVGQLKTAASAPPLSPAPPQ